MPFEVNRIDKECSRCKKPTIFQTPNGFFCGRCLLETK